MEKFSIASLLRRRGESDLPLGAEALSKPRGVCVDDGIQFANPGARIVALSGAGVGEVPDQVREIYQAAGVEKIKPHEGCGKARLVLVKQYGVAHPSDEEVDQFARDAASSLAGQIGVEVGRTIGFDHRKTRLDRPLHHHPANQAVIALSGRLPHNLLPQEELKNFPPHYNLEGGYLGNEDLQAVAIGEMGLVASIASGEHGVGIVSKGFQFVALADEDDPALSEKLSGLEQTFAVARDAIGIKRDKGETLNDISLDVVGYHLHRKKVTFSKIK